MAALTPDSLKAQEYAQRYGWATQVIFAKKELRDIFKEAVRDNLTDEEFEARIRGTKWYADNNEYARNAWMAYQTGGADATAYQENAKMAVQAAATQAGVRLTDKQLNQMATRYNTEGWGDPKRQQLMMNALSSEITPDEDGNLMGAAGNLQEQLMQLAAKNGVIYQPGYYISAARSVAMGLSTAEDWARDIRTAAKSLYPSLADKLDAGMDVKDVASSYISQMAQTFEVDPDQIPLSDPFIKMALGASDDKGNPRTMGLWEFQQKLRNDPRWMGTKQAVDEYSSAAHSVLQSFGMMGS